MAAWDLMGANASGSGRAAFPALAETTRLQCEGESQSEFRSAIIGGGHPFWA